MVGLHLTGSPDLERTGAPDRSITDPDRRSFVFVSDLHLAGERRLLPDERDQSVAFTRFVDDLTEQLGSTDSAIRLVVLGDMLDITRLEARIPRDGAVASSLRRLDSTANAHAYLFVALGRLISAGRGLDVVVGNHDLDLAHPEVQQRFIERLDVPPSGADARSITFHRWFLFHRDVVYAEHGHRYHDINVVPVPGGRSVPSADTPADVPFAAYLDSYLSASRAGGPARTLIEDLARLTRSLVARRARPGTQAPTSPDGRLRVREAADPGLDVDTLIAIDALAAGLGADTVVRVGRTVLGPPIRLVLPYAAAAGLVGLVGRGRSIRGSAIALASAAAIATLVRNRRRLWPPPRSTGYALDAAKDLRRTLERAGSGVPFYVLGHTHVPADMELDGPGRPARYINTGSWASLDTAGRGYPFVRVSRLGSGDPDAELCWWRVPGSA